MNARPSRVAFFPLRCELDPSGELEASRTFLDIVRRQSSAIEVVDLSCVGDPIHGRLRLALGNLKRLSALRATLRASSCDLTILKVPTPAQIAPLLPLLLGFRGDVVFWCDSLCFELPPTELALRMFASEPLLTAARLALNGRAWARLHAPTRRWVVVATQVQRAELVALGWDPSRIRVIPNTSPLTGEDAVGGSPVRSPTAQPFRMGYLGHLDCVKGVADLIASLRELRKGSREFFFHLAVSPLSAEKTLPDLDDPRLRVSGTVDRSQFLAGLDLLVLPYWANWGTNLIPAVLLEAMSLGLAVLTPDTALSREVLGDDYAGLYSRTDGMAFHRAVDRVLADPGCRPRGAALRERFFARYAPRRVEEAWQSFLHEALRQDETKSAYYCQQDVVDDYDRLRFMRGGGPVVLRVETRIVEEMIGLTGGGTGQIALDAPCGTGRFVPLLKRHFSCVLASDLSPAMLRKARSRGAHANIHADVSRLALRSASVHFILMSRFVFHFDDPTRFLAEAARVLVPGGHLLFDTYNWTPRHWIPGGQRFLGGRTYLHSRTRIAQLASAAGMEIVAERPAFLVAPYVYGFLPADVVDHVESLSRRTPAVFRAKTYYLLRKEHK